MIKGRYTIHYTEVAPLPPDNCLFKEFTTYYRELPRLLKEGFEGQFALIKGDEILGFFSTHDEAYAQGLERFLGLVFAVYQIREFEPVYLAPWAR